MWTCENVPLTSPTSFVTNTFNSFLHTKRVPNDHPAKVFYFVQKSVEISIFEGTSGCFCRHGLGVRMSRSRHWDPAIYSRVELTHWPSGLSCLTTCLPMQMASVFAACCFTTGRAENCELKLWSSESISVNILFNQPTFIIGFDLHTSLWLSFSVARQIYKQTNLQIFIHKLL